MIQIGGSSYHLLAEDKVAPAKSIVSAQATQKTGGVYTLDEHYRNIGWCRAFDEYTETFDLLNSAWDVSGVVSAEISAGKLELIPKLNTLADPLQGARLTIPSICGDFVISVNIEWSPVVSSKVMGLGYLQLGNSSIDKLCYVGFNDSWASELGLYLAGVLDDKWISEKVVPTSNSISVKVERISGVTNCYIDNVLKYTTNNMTHEVSKILLVAGRHTSSYGYYKFTYDNLYIKRRR